MNDTPTSSPEQADEYSVFVSFSFKGRDNGMDKQGFDSRVIKVPNSVKFLSAEHLKEVADAIASSEFADDKRYTGLEITLLNLVKLPL